MKRAYGLSLSYHTVSDMSMVFHKTNKTKKQTNRNLLTSAAIYYQINMFIFIY